jgi:hypothetical protein
MKWFLILVVYVAPNNAINWNGPWKLGWSDMVEKPFSSEAECRAAAKLTIAKIHKGMLAPIRYRCVSVDTSLPKGAPR